MASAVARMLPGGRARIKARCRGEPEPPRPDGPLLWVHADGPERLPILTALQDVRAMIQTMAGFAMASGSDAAQIYRAGLNTTRLLSVMSGERAIWESGSSVSEMLHNLGGYMAERATDVLDVRARIVAELRGVPAPGIPAAKVELRINARTGTFTGKLIQTARAKPSPFKGALTIHAGNTTATASIVVASRTPGRAPAQRELLIPWA